MTKEQLKEYKWIKENVKELEDRLLEIDTLLQKCTTNLDGDAVQITKNPDKWTSLINTRMEVEELINIEISKGLKEMVKIETAIAKLPEREKRLMRLRYIDCKRWENICVIMNYEWAQIHRIHGGILGKLKNRVT